MDNRIEAVLRSWLWPVAIICAFSGYLIYTAAESEWYCGPGEACLREWISALSGWVAALAAFITIVVMRRQIDDSDRNHREMIRLQNQPTITMTMGVIDLLQDIQTRCDGISFTLADRRGRIGQLTHDFTMDAPLKSLSSMLGDPLLDDFEAKVGSRRPGDLRRLREQLRRVLDSPKSTVWGRTSTNYDWTELSILTMNVQSYANHCELSGRQYVMKWQNYSAS